MSKSIDVVVRLQDELSKKLPGVRDNLMKSMYGVSRFGKQLQRTGANMEQVGKSTLSLISPVVALGGMALKTGMNFDKSMSQVQAVSGATGKELDNLRKKAIEIGSSTSKSASDAANAMIYLAQAGFKQNEIMKLSEPLVKLSIAGNMDMAETTDKWVGAIKSANIPLNMNSRFLDQVAKTSNVTNSNIGGLLETWQTAGASIQNSNMTMAQANALFGVLANASIKGAEAGTVVSRVFQRINAGTGECGKAFAKLKIATTDSTGALRNKIDVLKDIKEKTDKLTEAERVKILQDIGGKQYSEQLQQMLNGLGGTFDNLTGRIDQSNGSLKSMTKIMADNLFGDVTSLKSKFEAAMIHISDAIKPQARKMVQDLSKLFEKLATLNPHTIQTIAKITLLIAKFALFNLVVGKTLKTVGGFILTIGNLGKYLFGTKEGAHNLKNSITNLKTAFKVLTTPLRLTFKGLFKLTQLLKNGNIFSKIIVNLAKIGPLVKSGFGKIGIHAAKLIPIIAKVAMVFKGKLFGAFTKVFGLGKGLIGVLAGLGPIGWIVIGVAAALGVAGFLIYKNWSKVKKVFSNVKKSISDFAKNSLKNMAKFYTAFSQTALGKAMKPFLSSVKSVFGSLKKIFGGLIQFVTGVFSGNWSKAWEGVKNIFGGAVDLIINTWKMLGNLLSIPIRAVVLCLKDKFKGAIDTVKKLWNATKQLLSSAIKGTVSLLSDGFHAAIDGVKRAWNKLKDFLAHPIRSTVELFTGGADGSHSSGLNMVPFDNYRANLHRGEMVLTKEQADAYRNKTRQSNGKQIVKNIHIGKITENLTVNDKNDAEYYAKQMAKYIAMQV